MTIRRRNDGLTLVWTSALVLGLTFIAGVSAQDKFPLVVTKIGRYQLRCNPWINLHQRLLYEARIKTAPPVGLSGDGLTKWKKAVEDYGMFVRKRNPLFDDELIQLNAELSKTNTSKLPKSIPAAAAMPLKSAMPLYRAVQWEEDDRINRFSIAVVEPMLAAAGEELVEAHEKAYGVPFPKNILVDFSVFEGVGFGAYTVGSGQSVHVVVQSTDPGNQGFMALESMLHDPSHGIVGPFSGAIGAALTRLAKKLEIRPMSNLWHAILFYTSGELTRRALAKRWVSYKPIITLMYDGPFRGYKQALETHWKAYLDGRVSRDEAIRQILIETTPRKM